MHRCFQIPELLYNILENVSNSKPEDPPYWTGLGCQNIRDLLAVALVSKAFCEAALDALWSFQDSLPVLIKTFPRDLWTEDRNSKTIVSSTYILPEGVNFYLCSI
jgi:hypothetical protein